ncbi:MAG: NUDIX hydrolase [Pseudomonadota bacterium]
MRRFGDRPLPHTAYRRRPGAYGVILDDRGRALIALNECPGEEVALPGGGIDPFETPIRALHREAMEETGWRIAVTRRVGAYKRFVYMPEYDLWAEKICHVYLCRAGRRVADPIEPDHQPVWMDAEVAAAALSVDGDRAMFAKAL